MPKLATVIEDLDYVTEVLSARARTMATGVLALAWVFLLANATDDDAADLINNSALFVPICLALLALLSDLGQYWFGYLGTQAHYRNMQAQGLEKSKYDSTDWRYKLRRSLFVLKLVFMLVSVLWLLTLLLAAILL